MIPTRLLTLVALTAALGAVLPASIGVDAQSASAPPLSRKAQLLRRAPRDPALRAAIAEAREAGRDRGPDVVPGVLAVKFAEDTDPARVSTLAAHHGVDAVKQPAFTDFYLFTFDRDQDLAAAARALAAERGVVYAEPVGRARTTYRPNDPLYEFQWNFHQLDLERTWDINQGAGREVVVAVIDSGVAYTSEPGYAQATDLAGTTFLPGLRLHLGRRQAPRLRGARHPRHRDDRAVHQQQPRRCRHRVQRRRHSGEGGQRHHRRDLRGAERRRCRHGVPGDPLRGGTRREGDQPEPRIRVPSTPLRDAVQFAVDSGALVVVSAGNSADEGSPPRIRRPTRRRSRA